MHLRKARGDFPDRFTERGHVAVRRDCGKIGEDRVDIFLRCRNVFRQPAVEIRKRSGERAELSVVIAEQRVVARDRRFQRSDRARELALRDCDRRIQRTEREVAARNIVDRLFDCLREALQPVDLFTPRPRRDKQGADFRDPL